MRTDILGVGFDNITMDEAVVEAERIIDGGGRGKYVVTPNPEIVMLCRKNADMSAAVAGASLVLPDGIGVIYGAKILGRPLREKTPGVDFCQRVFGMLAARSGSVFLFGSKPGVAEEAAERIMREYPGLRVSGTADGYFDDSDAIVGAINTAAPDFLVVCLGAPKQELWMQANADRLNVPLMAGLGGALDVFAGRVKRAPKAWQRLNLEWLYRLLTDLRRLKRMIILPVFIFAVIGQKLKGDK